jgi:hypothetical protein
MKVNGIQCPNCKDIIYSRAGHDFRYCTCGECFVDGGQGEYGGRVGFTTKKPLNVEIELPAITDKYQLKADWGSSKNQYGLIQAGTKVDLNQQVLSFDGIPINDPKL